MQDVETEYLHYVSIFHFLYHFTIYGSYFHIWSSLMDLHRSNLCYWTSSLNTCTTFTFFLHPYFMASILSEDQVNMYPWARDPPGNHPMISLRKSETFHIFIFPTALYATQTASLLDQLGLLNKTLDMLSIGNTGIN